MFDVDLHIHSGFSNDGEWPVRSIIDYCSDHDVKVLSISDHNKVNAAIEGAPYSEKRGLNFIPGIEIDCCFKGIDLHLLGYNIDWKSKDFLNLEKSIHKKVMEAFPEMVDNLGKVGIEVDPSEILEKSQGKPPCGELIAEVLLTNSKYHYNRLLVPYFKGGDRGDAPYINFYHDYFAQGKPAYVKIEYMDFKEAVELVADNHGKPIVAHPGLNLKGKEEVINDLLEYNVEGMEVFNNYHNDDQVAYFARLALKEDLIMTCGSDFHGKNKPLIEIGCFKLMKEYENYLRKSVEKL